MPLGPLLRLEGPALAWLGFMSDSPSQHKYTRMVLSSSFFFPGRSHPRPPLNVARVSQLCSLEGPAISEHALWFDFSDYGALGLG